MARLKPYLILAVPWLGFVAYAWPGIMTWDSVNQLTQARDGVVGNWHPPVMARLWGVLDAIVSGPSLMLLLQTALFVLGLYAVLRRYFAPVRAATVAACVFLFPPVFAIMSGIWKDSLMAGCLLCGAAGIAATTRPARLGGWLALGFAAALRHNAPILILPLTALVVRWPPGEETRRVRWRRIAAGVAFGLALTAVAQVANKGLADVDDHPFANMLALPDIAGTLARAPDVDDATARELLDGAPLQLATGIQARTKQIKPERTGWVAVIDDAPALFALAKTGDEASGITGAWWRTLTTYPGAYLAYRARVFAQNIGWSGTRPPPFVTAREERARDIGYLGEVRDYAGYQLAIADFLRAISHWIIFWPILYIVLAIGLLVLEWRDPLLRALLGGALAYEAALFVVSPGGHDYRYSHWLITCTVIASVIRVAHAFTTARRQAAARGTTGPARSSRR
jgi:hypothetical protein